VSASVPVVECHGLSVGADPERPVLTGLDLRVEAGEIVVLLGPSGCGKSTLLRTLIGLLPPLAGEVRLFGEPVHELTGDGRRRLLQRTGTLFQHDALFGSMSIADNVELPLRETTSLPGQIIREMAALKLGLVGLGGLGQRSPAQLSGGQRKRAALARATILDPELVFCDEPSAGLDPGVAAGIDQTFLRMRSLFGSAFMIVTHEIASVRAIADRGLFFHHGRLRGEGPIDALTSSDDPVVRGFFHRVAAEPSIPTVPAIAR
jgi:phospholipid/cholesterol/gamma-HCH transport system ATP-binding protein